MSVVYVIYELPRILNPLLPLSWIPILSDCLIIMIIYLLEHLLFFPLPRYAVYYISSPITLLLPDSFYILYILLQSRKHSEILHVHVSFNFTAFEGFIFEIY